MGRVLLLDSIQINFLHPHPSHWRGSILDYGLFATLVLTAPRLLLLEDMAPEPFISCVQCRSSSSSSGHRRTFTIRKRYYWSWYIVCYRENRRRSSIPLDLSVSGENRSINRVGRKRIVIPDCDAICTKEMRAHLYEVRERAQGRNSLGTVTLITRSPGPMEYSSLGIFKWKEPDKWRVKMQEIFNAVYFFIQNGRHNKTTKILSPFSPINTFKKSIRLSSSGVCVSSNRLKSSLSAISELASKNRKIKARARAGHQKWYLPNQQRSALLPVFLTA